MSDSINANTKCNAHSTEANAQSSPSVDWSHLGPAPKTVAEAARVYDRLGWSCVPVEPRGKKPRGGVGWDKQQIGGLFGNLDEHFPENTRDNIGVRTGFRFAGSEGRLGDVDLDHRNAVAIASIWLPTTLTFGRGGAVTHRLYEVTGDPQTRKWKKIKKPEKGEKDTILEIRAASKAGVGSLQTVFPPSVHASGQQIAWTNWGARPAVIEDEDLRRRCAHIACAVNLADEWQEGARNDLSMPLARFLIDCGLSDDEGEKIIRALCLLTNSQDRSGVVRHTRAKMAAGDETTGETTLRGLIGDVLVDGLKKLLGGKKTNGAAPRDDFIRHPKTKGIVARSGHNVRVALEKMGIAVSHDEFADLTIIEGLDGFGPALDDAALHRVMLEIERRFYFLPQKDTAHMVLEDEASNRRFHPVRQYFDRAERSRDPSRRLLDDWLVRYCGAPDTPFVRAVGRIVLIAVVRRARHPGAKFDEILILESPTQGLQKSTLIEALAVRPEWYSDGLRLNAESRTIMEQTKGKLIIELPDLTGHDAKKINEAKAFASRKVDRARHVWHRFAEDQPRSCVFIATTNEKEYLFDPTGNRRFWPVEVARCDVDALTRDLDQLYGEAAAAETAGESIRLSPELYDEAAREQEGRVARDPWEDILREHLTERNTGMLPCGYVRSGDLWNLLGGAPVNTTGSHGARLGRAIGKLGFKRRQKRFGGDAEGVYRRGGPEHADYQIPLIYDDTVRRWMVSVSEIVIRQQRWRTFQEFVEQQIELEGEDAIDIEDEDRPKDKGRP